MHRPQADPPTWLEILESHVVELIEVAQREQALVHLLADTPLAAGANLQPAEVRVVDGQVEAQVTQPATKGAVRVAGQASCLVEATRISVR